MAVGGLLLGIIALFLPPLPVFWRRGCGSEFLICIVLLFLGWIPGVLYAWFIILDSPNMRQKHRMRQERRRSVGARSPMRISQETGSVVSSGDRYVRRRSRSRGGYREEVVYAGPPAYYPPPPERERGYRRKY